MASSINTAHPQNGVASTANVRANFSAAKSEIETLQSRSGFVDYNDSATSTTPISLTSSTWTKLTNNKLGIYTKTDALPSGITNVWNSTTNQLDFTQIPVNSMVRLRADYTVTTTSANQVVRLRILFAIGDASQFSLQNSESHFKSAGAQVITSYFDFYIGSNAIKNTPAEIQLFTDASATAIVRGWYIVIDKAI